MWPLEVVITVELNSGTGIGFGASLFLFFFSFLCQVLGVTLRKVSQKVERRRGGKLFRTSALIPDRNIARPEGVAAVCGCESHHGRTNVSTYAAAAAPSLCIVAAAAAAVSSSLAPHVLQLFLRTIFGQG